jgi:uncharacterized protein (TIGR03000 family)
MFHRFSSRLLVLSVAGLLALAGTVRARPVGFAGHAAAFRSPPVIHSPAIHHSPAVYRSPAIYRSPSLHHPAYRPYGVARPRPIVPVRAHHRPFPRVFVYPWVYEQLSVYYPQEYVLPEATEASPPEFVVPDVAPAPAEATVDVVLPDPDADVFFNGEKMPGTGTDRRYLTPPLEPGPGYHYVVRASWRQDGKVVSDERRVDVFAGTRSVVDFTRPAPKRPAP